jgi:hypothetical protein
MNKVFNNTLAIFLTCCVLAVPALAPSGEQGFHHGEIVSVDKDTRLIVASADVTRYYVSIQVDDSAYVYLDEVESGQELQWRVGQSLQVTIVGQSIQVERATGEIDTYPIVSAGTSRYDGDQS